MIDGLEQMIGALQNPHVPYATKRAIAERYVPLAKAELGELEAELAATTNRISVREKKIAHMEAAYSLIGWLETPAPVLERNDCSRLHRLIDAMREGRIADCETGESPDMTEALQYVPSCQPFVMAHDWKSAFGDALGDVGGDVRMPYQECAFELRISGKNVIVLVWQHEEKTAAMSFVETGAVWAMHGATANEYRPLQFAWDQILAASVALDARVATHDVIRAPSALNKKRERTGLVPLFDFHIVRLAKRVRAAPVAGSDEHHRRHRLHFRRGHWRHFETRKTWINWMLVGDPDLGFIAKHYTL